MELVLVAARINLMPPWLSYDVKSIIPFRHTSFKNRRNLFEKDSIYSIQITAPTLFGVRVNELQW
jgi:hypothetical protein